MPLGRHFWLWVAVLWSFGAACAMAAQPQNETPATILSGCEYDYAPFCTVRDGKEADGFSVQLLRAALKAMGRDVSFKTAPWAEIKQDLADGRLQCLPMVARTADREGSFDFTFPYYTMHGTIVVRDDNTDIRGPDDLKGKRVAVLREDIAHEYLRSAGLGAVIVPLPSFATALRELSEGKHDAVVIQKLAALQIIRESGLKNLQTVGPPLSGYSQVFCFAVRKGDKELLSLLNEGLSIVMADGTFRRLHAEWFSSLEAMGRARSRIVVGGDANYPPYEFLDANGQPAGYNVDLTRAIARQMGLSVEIRLSPWAKVREALDRGEIDAVPGMFYSTDRDRRFGFSQAHTMVQHVIVVRKGTRPPAGMRALEGKSILVMAGDIMHDLALKHGYGSRVVAVPSEEEALRRLAAGEQDCALTARVPALYWIEKNRWNNLEVGDQPMLSAEFCYAVPHGKEALLAEFTEGLAVVQRTGEYRTIRAKWLAPYDLTQVGWTTILGYALLGAVPLMVLLGGALLWTRSLHAQVRRRTREVRESEDRYRRLVETATEGIWQIDTEFRTIYVNARMAQMLGHTPEEMAGQPISQFMAPEALQDVGLRSENRRKGMAETYERQLRRKDGSTFWVLVSATPLRDEGGPVIGSLGVFTDITDRRLGEEALRQSEEQSRSALRRIELLADTAGELLSSREPQKAVEALCRRVMQHLDCHAFFNFLVDDEAGRLHLNACAGIPEEETRRIEWLDYGTAVCGCAARDGCRIVAEHIPTTPDPRTELVKSYGIKAYACHPLLGPAGEVMGTLSFGTRSRETFSDQDLSLMKAVADHVAVAMSRMRTESSLRQARAIAESASKAKDQFIAVLSHELRTPLTPAVAALSMLQSDARLPADVREDLDMVSRNIDLEVRLIADLLDVSRIISGKLHLEKRPVDVAGAIREAAKIVSGDLDAKGQLLSIETPDAPYLTFGDAARLQQVFWNLLRNSIKFSPAHSRITIRARVIPLDRCPLAAEPCPVGMGECPLPQAGKGGSPACSGNLIVEISDQGIGIAREMLPRLFNAFEQEQQARSFGGLGLGLSICRAVVELHDGTISVRSDGAGCGATFTVCLPVAQCPLSSPSEQPAQMRAGPAAAIARLSLRGVRQEEDAA